MSRSAEAQLGGFQLTTLVVLRMLVGWHFLYEGIAKITSEQWSSAGYLQASQGWFAETFQDLAANAGAVGVIDLMNEWGLTLIGLALLVGVFTRTAAAAGIVLLALYYAAAPPMPGLEYAIPTEGSYLIVNKVLVELAALMVLLALPTSHRIGLDRILRKSRTPVEAT